MKMIIKSTEIYAVVFISLPNKEYILMNIPYDCFDLLENGMRKEPQMNMLNPYPFGDFEKILSKERPIGLVSKQDFAMECFMVPEGVIFEARDHISGEVARSKAIPRSAFNSSTVINI